MIRVPFFKFECTELEIDQVTSVLKSGWLTTAGKVFEFESKFLEYTGAKYALAVNSCTSALHLALEAVGVGPGDRVVVPTLTFTATAEVVRYLGAELILVDVNAETGLMEAQSLQNVLDKEANIKACIVVHYAGQLAELRGENGIYDLCEKNNIKLIQDAAHSFPACDSYGRVGSVGDITCFSFYANKTITTGEGGMIVTDNPEYAERMKIMRLHGINRDVWNRFTSGNNSWEYDVVAPGYKYNMPDLNAAVGLAQFTRAEIFRKSRQRCAEFYLQYLSKLQCIRMMECRVALSSHAWHLFPIVVLPDAPIDRDVLISKLTSDGIAVSVHYKPIHRLKYYIERYNLQSDDFPNAESIWNGCLSLPIYPLLTEDMLEYVCDRLNYHLG